MPKEKNTLEEAPNTSRERSGRSQWRRWYAVTIAVLGTASVGMCSILPTPPSTDQSAGQAPAERATADAQPCNAPGQPEQDAVVSRDAVLRLAPAANAPAIVNPEATAKPAEIEAYATVTPELPLRRSCDAAGWTRVRVLATGLRWMEGWLATSSLRSLKLDRDGRRALTASDIVWRAGSEGDRTAIIKVANKIVREDERCEAIDNRSLLVEGNAGNRRYTLLCDGPAGPIPIEFTARDAGTRSFAIAAVDPDAPEATPISKTDAGAACMEAIRLKLSQPNSVDFHTFTDTMFSSDGPRSRFTVGFTAKNGLGNEIDSTAACTFDGEEMMSAEVLPSGS